MKKLRVTVEGKNYDVLVEVLDPGPAAAPATVAPSAPIASVTITPPPTAAAAPVAVPSPAPARAAGGAGDVPSPLAGKLVSIDVQVGQTVAEGAQVATVEAMKMNTYILATKAGRVAAILVNPGDGVQEGTVILQIA